MRWNRGQRTPYEEFIFAVTFLHVGPMQLLPWVSRWNLIALHSEVKWTRTSIMIGPVVRLPGSVR